ncbi:MAG: 6-bladed beta-propeller [Tannerellaceae bacterium]|nr:6-bladed beta-propeller [Tannerellaceae bacterium]
MKRAFFVLIIVISCLYGKLGYELLMEDSSLKSLPTGSLSDIAETVTAIPLQSTGKEKIGSVKSIQQESGNLFLISNDILYRFSRSGDFICRITNPQTMRVAGYAVDPLNKRLIVLGNEADIHYYSYTGELLDAKKMDNNDAFKQVRSIVVHNNYIWTTEENVCFDPSTGQLLMERTAVKYDPSFLKIESRTLSAADLTKKPLFPSFLGLELAFTEATGQVYAYSPTVDPESLLQDTLLLHRRQLPPCNPLCAEQITVYPLRFGQRYWLSSYKDPSKPSESCTFCFDRDSCKSWQIEGGFKDNFYHTGSIAQLQAMDVYSNSYYYCKYGKELKQKFPGRTDTDAPVIFIVQLKV